MRATCEAGLASGSASRVYQPVGRGEVLLLLELLLQTHELQLGEDGAAPARLLEARPAVLRVRLAADADGRLTGRGVRASCGVVLLLLLVVVWMMGVGAAGEQRQVLGHPARGRGLGLGLGEVGGYAGGLPRDHGEERVGAQ